MHWSSEDRHAETRGPFQFWALCSATNHRARFPRHGTVVAGPARRGHVTCPLRFALLASRLLRLAAAGRASSFLRKGGLAVWAAGAFRLDRALGVCLVQDRRKMEPSRPVFVSRAQERSDPSKRIFAIYSGPTRSAKTTGRVRSRPRRVFPFVLPPALSFLPWRSSAPHGAFLPGARPI